MNNPIIIINIYFVIYFVKFLHKKRILENLAWKILHLHLC